jgi:hypothetical protein
MTEINRKDYRRISDWLNAQGWTPQEIDQIQSRVNFDLKKNPMKMTTTEKRIIQWEIGLILNSKKHISDYER